MIEPQLSGSEMTRATVARQTIELLIDPTLAEPIASAWNESRATLLICPHEYLCFPQQINLYRQARVLLEHVPGIQLFLDGVPRSESKRPGPPVAEQVERLLRAQETTAAYVLGESYPATHVDELVNVAPLGNRAVAIAQAVLAGERTPRDQTALVTRYLAAVDLYFAKIALALLAASLAHSASVRVKQLLLLEHMTFTTYTYPMRTCVEILRNAAGSQDVPLADYPALSSMASALELERFIDFPQVERERLQLVERIARVNDSDLSDMQREALAKWLALHEGDAARYAELAKARGELDSSPYEVKREHSVAARALDQLVWFSLAYRMRRISDAAYYDYMAGLLKLMNVSVGDLAQLDSYIEYILIAGRANRGELMGHEFPAIFRRLAEILAETDEDYALLELCYALRDLQLAYRFELPASSARRFMDSGVTASAWLTQIQRLASSDPAFPTSPEQARMLKLGHRFAERLDGVRSLLDRHYAEAITRSQAIWRRTIDRLAEDGGTGLLICSRFDLGEAIEMLRAEDSVSWTILAPKPEEFESDKGKATVSMRMNWCWFWSDKEFSLPWERLRPARSKWAGFAQSRSSRLMGEKIPNLPRERLELAELPGMPRLTRLLRQLAAEHTGLPLRLMPSRQIVDADVAAYNVYFGAYLVGRYTVRRYQRRVERNFLFLLPAEQFVFVQTLPQGVFGVSGTPFEDLVRIASEKLAGAENGRSS